MTQFLKRGMTFLLVVAFAFGLCACGSQDQSPAGESVDYESAQEQEVTGPFRVGSFADKAVTLVSAVPYEDEKLCIEVTDLVYSPEWDENGTTENGLCLMVYYSIENRSASDLKLESIRCHVNGFACNVSDQGWQDDKYIHVPAGATVETYSYIKGEQFTKNCIEQVGEGDILFEVYGDKTYDSRPEIRFVARENHTQRKFVDGQVVYENDGLKIVAQGCGEWTDAGWWGYDTHMRFYVENNSDQVYAVSMEQIVHSKGYDLESPPFVNETVGAGKQGHVFVDVGDYYDRSDVETVAFRIKVSVEEQDGTMFYFDEQELFVTEQLSLEQITIAE